MKKDNIIPELHEADEPVMEQGPSEEEKLAELAKIEAEEALEDEAADELDLEEGVEEMTEEELKATVKEIEKPKPIVKPVTQKVVAVKKETIVPKAERVNDINAEKCMLYHYPTPKEWEQIHKLQPDRIVFYFTMSKHEYKELFLCQIKYRTKIIGSTGARVI